MFKGAIYKSDGRKGNCWGWDYAKVLDIRSGRSIHWTPDFDRADEKHSHFWNDMPSGDIKLIVDKRLNVVVYFYNLEAKPDTSQRSIIEIDELEFCEGIEMHYSLVSIEGVSEDV